jgi:hypothetical protein
MDHMQQKLFLTGAFTGMDDEKNALRKPKSSEKEWELATLKRGECFGLAGLKDEAHYIDTARAFRFAKLMFMPIEVLMERLKDVKAPLLKELEEQAQSRGRQFDRVSALFAPQKDAGDEEEKERALIQEQLNKVFEAHSNPKLKKLDTGLSQVIPPVLQAKATARRDTSAVVAAM